MKKLIITATHKQSPITSGLEIPKMTRRTPTESPKPVIAIVQNTVPKGFTVTAQGRMAATKEKAIPEITNPQRNQGIGNFHRLVRCEFPGASHQEMTQIIGMIINVRAVLIIIAVFKHSAPTLPAAILTKPVWWSVVALKSAKFSEGIESALYKNG